MDLKTLKTKFPETHAAAVAEGVAQEYDRVSAHLMCGTKFGAMDVALKAIKEKVGLTAELQTEYIDTATSRFEQRARQLDSDEAGAVLENAAAPAAVDLDNGDKVAAAMGLSVAPPPISAAAAVAAVHSKPGKQLDNGDKVILAMNGFR